MRLIGSLCYVLAMVEEAGRQKMHPKCEWSGHLNLTQYEFRQKTVQCTELRHYALEGRKNFFA
jgi:hypothetical protein